MPAVVRVKRRIDEEPLGAFVLNGKKRRIDENTTQIDSKDSTKDNLLETKDEISTILKFAGTVESQDEKATTQIARLSKDEAKELAKKHRQPINATERARQEMRAHGHENRFKVVNCFRTIDTNSEESTSKEITIVDIEKQPLATTVDTINVASTSSRSSPNDEAQTNYTPTDSDGYVYDLYLPENEQQADDVDYTDNYLSIRVFDDLVYEDRYNSEDDDNASEDSNQENYFGNDYPDEEDDNDSVTERDMRRAVEGLNLGSDEDEDEDEFDDEDLSSEDEYYPYEDDYISSVNAEDNDFDDDVDFVDVDRYGTAYAKYKAKVLRAIRDKNDDAGDNSKSSSDAESNDE